MARRDGVGPQEVLYGLWLGTELKFTSKARWLAMRLMKCVKCRTRQEPGERFCRGCGERFQVEASPALPSTIASTRAPTPPDATLVFPASSPVAYPPPAAPTPRQKSRWRIPLGVLLALSVLTGIISFASQMVIQRHWWAYTYESSVATTFMVASCFFFAWSLAMLFPRLYMVCLLPSVIWAALGLLGFLDVFVEWGYTRFQHNWLFWSHRTFATGLGNLIGGIIGLVISIIARRLRQS